MMKVIAGHHAAASIVVPTRGGMDAGSMHSDPLHTDLVANRLIRACPGTL
jgi:hypothetical protein